jgi:hypothetical protein
MLLSFKVAPWSEIFDWKEGQAPNLLRPGMDDYEAITVALNSTWLNHTDYWI